MDTVRAPASSQSHQLRGDRMADRNRRPLRGASIAILAVAIGSFGSLIGVVVASANARADVRAQLDHEDQVRLFDLRRDAYQRFSQWRPSMCSMYRPEGWLKALRFVIRMNYSLPVRKSTWWAAAMPLSTRRMLPEP